MKSPSFPAVTRRSRTRGFALIVTLSLMILLTVIAVGLLTLSSVSLRSSSQAENMQAARSNARMALLLAIGDLQKQLGPDTRVSTTADQIIDTKPTESSTPPNQRQWAGAWRSWQAAAPADSRPAPEFLQWLVSGDPTKINQKSFSGGVLGTKATDSVEIVSLNTVGDPNLAVRVPLITSVASNGTKNNCAWWVSDLGTKGFVAPAKEIPTAIAETRGDQQGAPAYHLAAAASGTARPFQQLAVADPKLSRIATWQSSALLADKPQNIRGLFHDFTTHNQGLLTNVRAGGFRKDLSMQLERTAGAAPQSTSTALYTVQGETGINLQELWVYYNSYKTSELRRGGSATFTTGGTMSSGTPHFD